ncbi:MAG: hypothetical protein AB9835_12845 [Eubacteriales bacterium]
MIIFTLGQIKSRVWMMLEEYTRDGAPAEVNHTHLADIRQRMPDAIDAVQRKIALCGRRLRKEVKLYFSLPTSVGDTVSLADKLSGSRVVLPSGAKAYSLTLRGGGAAVRFLALSEEGEDLVGEVSYECGWGEEKRFSGYVPEGAGILLLAGQGNVAELVFYSDVFPTTRLIPPYGYGACPLPGDVMTLVSLRRADGSGTSSVIREEERMLFLEGEGEYVLTYERYPRRVDATTPDECSLELDDICCDALVYGAAHMLCPLSQSQLYLKLRGMFEEAMANLYNAYPLGGQVVNTMFKSPRLRRGI